ncbi:MAG TPA: hypothetical protein ENI64_11735 [Gammaproteobacteria bacterium]|nr:hypothetical protein [Gammaproteobacteria bacterium]
MKFGTTYVLAVVMLSVTAPAAARSDEGYAWANNPTIANYIPLSTYSYNSSGGSITVTRRGAGTYTIRFAGLGGQGSAGGHAQVSAYGAGSAMCKINNWDSARADFTVNVRCYKSGRQAIDSKFLVNVFWPQKTSTVRRLRPAQPAILSPSSANQTSPTRSISAKGNVVFTYPDGKIVEYYDGGFKTTMPDGSISSASYSTQAPVAIPTEPPTGATQSWLVEHNDGLLSIINTLVGNDKKVIDDYLAFEGQDSSIYQKISKRRTIIGRLTSR